MDKFEPNVESLRNYKCPEWFRNAKFGIYLHWGVYSVAERGEWYARQMYIEGDSTYQHHVKTYGHQSKFGYKNFIPMWKAERFDPDRLVGLFKRAGAKYFTPCAVHHDNFDLWNSKYHKWNSVNMGPKKDITGLWRESALKYGLRFGTTTHLERSYSWFNVNKGADKSGDYKGVPYDGNDPNYYDYYFEPHDDTDLRQPRNAPESWRKTWAMRIKDLIDNYHPDLLYFDGAIPFMGDDQARTGLEVIAHYYNQNMSWHDGNLEAVMCVKDIADHGYFIKGVTILDIEGGRADRILPDPWQTDHSIGSWGYHAPARYRPVKDIIHELVDIVSKNGNLLLNVPPKADGTLDDETEKILNEIGQWFDVNGEAIYNTRPYTKHAEDDLRYVKKDNNIYVIALEWIGNGKEMIIPSVDFGKVSRISLLGYNQQLKWEQKPDSLVVILPIDPPCKYAYSFKVEF